MSPPSFGGRFGGRTGAKTQLILEWWKVEGGSIGGCAWLGEDLSSGTATGHGHLSLPSSLSPVVTQNIDRLVACLFISPAVGMSRKYQNPKIPKPRKSVSLCASGCLFSLMTIDSNHHGRHAISQVIATGSLLCLLNPETVLDGLENPFARDPTKAKLLHRISWRTRCNLRLRRN